MTASGDRSGTGPILVIGAGGMLGNALVRYLMRAGLAVAGTIRGTTTGEDDWFPGIDVISGVDLAYDTAIERAIADVEPGWIVNCAAVLRAKAGDTVQHATMTAINAQLPHRLAALSTTYGARLIHISTDGVFDGAAAPYDERDAPTPADPYAASKLAGEPAGDHVLTLRLSLIGRSPAGRGTLVDWILGLPRRAEISGFSRSVFSGLPVHEVARFLAEHVIVRTPAQSGLFHLAGPPISKADLIRLVLARAGRDDVIVRDDPSVVGDRTLISRRSAEFGDYRAPEWPRMIDDMFDFYATFGLAA